MERKKYEQRRQHFVPACYLKAWLDPSAPKTSKNTPFVCHEAIAKRGMQAIIPTRRHAKPWKDQRLGATVRNAFLRPRNGLVGKSGRGRAPITGAALSRPRCDVSNSLVNASWRVTLTAKSPYCWSVLPSSIGSLSWAHPRLWR
jgi:hypothetical protein